MAAGVIRNFLIQAPTPAYFPLIFQHSPCKEDDDVEMLEEKPEARDDEEEREVDEEEEEEEEEEDEESEAQEEDEGCLEVFLNPAHYALDVTKQLLRFADLISRDVQRYFGRCSGDQDACDIYSDSVSVTTGGRLRYYDDLLKIARAGSPEEPDGRSVAEDQGVGSAKGHSGLGPLAELFNHRGQSQGRGQPMIKRLLPLSFWTEPIPGCSLVSFGGAADVTHTHTHTHSDAPSQDSTHTYSDTHTDSDTHAHQSTHTYSDTHTDSDTHAHHSTHTYSDTHTESDTHAHQSTHTYSDTHTESDTHAHQSTHTYSDTHTESDTHAHQSTHTYSDTHAHCTPLPHHGAHALDNTQLDFSDLLAYWDPNPELTHTLTENTHMQH